MSSSTVKCNSCNVVINELLAFLRNVLDVMDEESVHQLCTSSFTAEEIVKAKTLLFDSIPSGKKMPVRRKDGKKKMSRDLDDMICLLKGTNPDIFPIFVAKELHKLPPVSFDHVDVTRLLKDILKLQNKTTSVPLMPAKPPSHAPQSPTRKTTSVPLIPAVPPSQAPQAHTTFKTTSVPLMPAKPPSHAPQAPTQLETSEKSQNSSTSSAETKKKVSNFPVIYVYYLVPLVLVVFLVAFVVWWTSSQKKEIQGSTEDPEALSTLDN